MNVYLGIVTKVLSETNHTIEFTVKGLVEAMKAYPIDVADKPSVKDSVIVYEIDSELFGYSYLYQKLRISDYTRIAIGKTQLMIEDDNISISSGSTSITLDKDNNISIDSNTSVTISANTSVNLNATSKVEVTAPNVSLKGSVNVLGALTVNGSPVLV